MSDFTPVARLLSSLRKAKAASNQKRVNHVWGEVFCFSPEDDIDLYEGSLSFYKLVEHVEESVVMLCEGESFEDLYRKQYRPIKKLALTFTSRNSWGTVKNKIDDAMILNLEHSKALYNMHAVSAESRVDDAFIKDLLSNVESLFDQVFYSDLSREIKLKILDDVNAVKSSLKFYAFHGRDGVEKSMTAVIGRIGMNGRELLKPEHKNVRAGMMALFTSFWGFMNASNVAASFIENAQEAVKFLESK